tara:strand:- start:1111 stop:1281 length:171 start_codon:yes stop_codon:yes gene_type:complete
MDKNTDMIDAILSQSPSDFKDAFDTKMKDIVFDKMEDEKKILSQDLIDDDEVESED